MQYSLLYQTPATETVYDRIQTHPKYIMGFLSHSKYGSNLVEISPILNYYFLNLSSTPKDSTSHMPMTFPKSNSCTRAKARALGCRRIPADIRASSDSPWEKRSKEGWATAHTDSCVQSPDLFIMNFLSGRQAEYRKHRNFTI